jgi:hypothetical protein
MTEPKKKKDDYAFEPLPVQKDSMASIEEVRKNMESFRANVELFLEYQRARATINREIYNSMIREGFTQEEAFTFVLQKGM